MKLSIGGVETYLKRIPIPGNNVDHILRVQLLNSRDSDGLHERLVTALKQRREHGDGVMHTEKFERHENRPGESEIRILGGLELEVIHLARLLGYGVEQVYERPEDTTSSD